jgi:hypothetical protein
MSFFSYPASGVLASVKKIKERPEEVKRLIKRASSQPLFS